MKPVTLAIVGAGSRGLLSYAPYAEKFPEHAKIVAVAEPRDWFFEEARRRHAIEDSLSFRDWKEFVDKPQIADAAIIATQDNMHVEPAIALMKKGYHLLLEKPMAPNEEGCRAIVKCAKETNRIVAVCHVLRYTPYFRKLKEILDSGVLGQIITLRHMEHVGFWHQAHSYVRGNWRKEELSSPMLLAKSCHDLDILLYLLGKRCLKVSSFGSLTHFKESNAPEEATARCVDCSLAKNVCPYSASHFYETLRQKGELRWPLNVVVQDLTPQSLDTALREGPYGRCVYKCDNDVVDHQVVNMHFSENINVAFTMNAFTNKEFRCTEIFGSHGELWGDGKEIVITNFADRKDTRISLGDDTSGLDGGHMGGDFGIMKDFINAIQKEDVSFLTSDVVTSMESHLIAFAAERSRKDFSVEDISLET